MPIEIVVALIVAITSLIGSITTLIIGLRSVRVEREKLQIERERLQSEISKLQAETEKLKAESDDFRRQRAEIERVTLEIDKEKELALLHRRKDIYPEILELVYRLRNGLRECLEYLNTEENGMNGLRFLNFNFPKEPLYLLTDNLYKYRAFIDEETFRMLHQYKHLLQDARVIFNIVDRPASATTSESLAKAFVMRYQESKPELDEIYQEVDDLYPSITNNIKRHIETVLSR